MNGAVEVGQRAPVVADLAVGIAVRDQGVDIVRLQHQHLVEILDGAIVGAFAGRQQDAASEIGQRVVRVDADRVAVVGKGAVGLAHRMQRRGAAVEVQRIGIPGIDGAVIVLERLRVILGGQHLVTQRRTGNAASEPGQGDFGRLEPPGLQRRRAGSRASLGVLDRRPGSTHALVVKLGHRLVGKGSGERRSGRGRATAGRADACEFLLLVLRRRNCPSDDRCGDLNYPETASFRPPLRLARHGPQSHLAERR